MVREFETFIQKKDENGSKTISNLNYFPSGLWAKVTDTGENEHFKQDEMKETHFLVSDKLLT